MGSVYRAAGVDDGEERARKGHMGFVNTNPFLSTFVAGAVARMEADVSSGKMDRSSLESLKSAVANTLASKGDQLFWGTLRPLAVLVGSVATLAGQGMLGLIIMFAIYTPVQLGFRAAGAPLAMKHGSMWLAREFGKRIETAALLLGSVLALVFGAAAGYIIAEASSQATRVLGVALLFAVSGVLSAKLARETTLFCGCLLIAAGLVWRFLS
jgi:mannose/fructose/N-acetylgalactosamine-specific phosphotransferase system component IID